ncbi:MAG: ferritin-like protein [Ferruginibacter sp.]|uniref:YciE/YciF ferroxidase family protein n=1 Tax=Ferruginibacter sp. TaxID=1940288 RepID=UPI00265B6BAC|nr:ferritin-like domain-containing protein [Ferruginibacter sp.]MDB5278596.1 ferritin-like protein [Ferruginibacter sp.]
MNTTAAKKSNGTAKSNGNAKSNGSTKSSNNTKRKSSASAGKGEADSMLKYFFTDELKDIYWAEKHLTKALPKMAKAAMSEELRDAITEHLEVTKTHVSRLEQVFGLLGQKAQAKKCDAMEGLVKEGESIVEDTEAGTSTRDVGIILASQKIEHYEIATYGGLAQLAATLGLTDAADILNETLAEEKEADQLLTEIAENDIN